MNTSEVPDDHSSQNITSSHVLKFENDQLKCSTDTDNTNQSIDYDQFNKTTLSQNATNSHPLMYSSISPTSADYPDVVPEKPKLKLLNYDSFKPKDVEYTPELKYSSEEYNALPGKKTKSQLTFYNFYFIRFS